MASNPPGICCLVAVKHEGVPTGKLIDFHGIETYTAGDATSKKIVVIVTDIFGHTFVNTQLIADAFAAQGYYVLVPDILKGDPIPYMSQEELAKYNLPGWLSRHTVEITEPIVTGVIANIKADFAPTSIGAVGYCFGAKYVVRLLGDKAITAGAIAHPSFITEEEVEKVTLPIIISAAEVDRVFPAENRAKTEAILVKNKATYEITVYAGTTHGFACRVDPTIAVQKYAKERAFSSQVAFFAEHLK
ncbi:dienelactone hydrolase [Lipomyces arxii]|uniref:dienelactone hydrolase n=1 Tax=Lipomyces arxii TaxID=56418 RepID=UPI0034CEBFE4